MTHSHSYSYSETRMSKSRFGRGPAVAAAVLALGLASWAVGGCRYDGTGTKMQWAPDMADAPTAKPQKTYLDPPAGAVAMEGVDYPKTPEEAETTLKVPERVDQDPEASAKGKALFETFCSVCHGLDGKGVGTLGPKYPQAADLTNPLYHTRGDGFFFFRITFGGALMPAYGHAISVNERWYIVRYVRELQKAGGTP
jgi:mono/diheme cytochrome c family protein